jgi:protein-tyrosine phosphatase
VSLAERLNSRIQPAVADALDALAPALPAGPDEADIAILFVCRGNVCRSPVAEAIFISILAREGVLSRVRVASAGTHGEGNTGRPPHWRARAEARRHRLNLGRLRARQVTAMDLMSYDRIYAMDGANVADLTEVAATLTRPTASIQLMDPQGRDIPDPIRGGRAEFAATYASIDRACGTLFERLRAEGEIPSA